MCTHQVALAALGELTPEQVRHSKDILNEALEMLRYAI